MAKKNEKTEQKAVNLTIDNYISILREQSEQDELQAMEIASNYIDLYEQPEQTLTGIKREYKAKLLPLVLYETEDGKQLVGIAGDPELNPTAPEYDSTRLQDELLKMRDEIRRVDDLLTLQRVNAAHRIANAAEKATEIKANDAKDDIVGILRNIGQWARDNLPGIDWDLLPYIAAEMDKAESAGTIDLHKPVDAQAPEWQQLIQAAKLARQEEKSRKALELPTLDGDKVEKINYPISKVNREIWERARGDLEGQYSFLTETIKGNEGVSIAVDLAALPVDFTRELTPYDKRVWNAAISLWVQGCRTVTASNIFYTMGNNTRPSPNQIKKLNKSMYKLSLTKIKINNFKEAAASHYPVFYERDFYLLVTEGTRAINPANGQIVEGAYSLPEEEPKLLTFARLRNQITTFDRALYCAPVSQTDNGIKLVDYLIDRILDIKDGRANSNKILYNTIYELLGTKANHKEEIKDKILSVLDFFKSDRGKHFIYDWQEAPANEKPGVYILVKKQEKLPQK